MQKFIDLFKTEPASSLQTYLHLQTPVEPPTPGGKRAGRGSSGSRPSPLAWTCCLVLFCLELKIKIKKKKIKSAAVHARTTQQQQQQPAVRELGSTSERCTLQWSGARRVQRLDQALPEAAPALETWPRWSNFADQVLSLTTRLVFVVVLFFNEKKKIGDSCSRASVLLSCTLRKTCVTSLNALFVPRTAPPRFSPPAR